MVPSFKWKDIFLLRRVVGVRIPLGLQINSNITASRAVNAADVYRMSNTLSEQNIEATY